MGTFQVSLEIGDSGGSRYREVATLVDTGPAYAWIPHPLLDELGLEPAISLPFLLADGRVVERDLTETRVRLDGHVRTTIVVFGDENSDALLGANTLEGFGLMVNPVNRCLAPVERFPMGHAAWGNVNVG